MTISAGTDISLWASGSPEFAGKISDTHLIVFKWFQAIQSLEFSGGTMSRTNHGGNTPMSPAIYTPQEMPYSNRYVTANVDPSTSAMTIEIIDFSTSSIGSYNRYQSSSVLTDVTISGDAVHTTIEFAGLALFSSTSGYAVIKVDEQDGLFQTIRWKFWYKPFTISGNSISLGSAVNFHNVDPVPTSSTTYAEPTNSIGLYNGSAVQFWNEYIWNGAAYDDFLRFQVITSSSNGGSSGSTTEWITGDTLIDGEPLGGTWVNVQAALISTGMLIRSPRMGRYAKCLQYSPSVNIGALEIDSATYPPDSSFVDRAVFISLGYQKGVIVYNQNAVANDNIYAAEIDPDENTQTINVNQATRGTVAFGTVPVCGFQMLSGTEACLFYIETVGGTETHAVQLTGLPGYVNPPEPPSSIGNLWIYKTTDRGISWTSRGIKTEE